MKLVKFSELLAVKIICANFGVNRLIGLQFAKHRILLSPQSKTRDPDMQQCHEMPCDDCKTIAHIH
jgi:hypothetical protein